MWRRRRVIRVFMFSFAVLFVVYLFTFQLSPTKYRNKTRKLVLPQAVVVHEAGYVNQELVGPDPYSKHAFNVAISNKQPADRPLPDTRPTSCSSMYYDIPDGLATSVIIVFYNEARSALLRTIISVLNRTPTILLQEILLVDDCSDNSEDGAELSSLPKVKLLRNKERKGLIASRNLAADEAQGHFLAFLDSHCEVNIGWLEPLIDAVSQEPTKVAVPVIDVIDLDTFQYRSSSNQLKGGFDWSLHFKWIPLSNKEKSNRADPSVPYMTPAIAGGLFLIVKNWFQKLGKFDSGLHIWGAESLELSLKTWLCGGLLEVIPCSRVGHVFRKKHPYSFPQGNAQTFLRNTKRVAEVWLGEYKRFFYEARPTAIDIDPGSLDEQMQLPKTLECQSFQWYMDTVFPELRLPNEEHSAFGQLQQDSLCLLSDVKSSTVFLGPCSDAAPSWAYNTGTQEIQLDKLCITDSSKNPALQKCQGIDSQKWLRQGRTLVSLKTNRCLEGGVKSEVLLAQCRSGSVAQYWDFTVELQTQYDSAVNFS